MIISRKQAEEARATLEIAPALDDIDAALLKSMYRLRAIEHHPDRGGDVAVFVAMDRAKCILEQWLARTPTDRPKGLAPTACGNCHGTGRIKVQRGFTSMTVTCQPCGGTGDADIDKEKHDGARGG